MKTIIFCLLMMRLCNVFAQESCIKFEYAGIQNYPIYSLLFVKDTLHLKDGMGVIYGITPYSVKVIPEDIYFAIQKYVQNNIRYVHVGKDSSSIGIITQNDFDIETRALFGVDEYYTYLKKMIANFKKDKKLPSKEIQDLILDFNQMLRQVAKERLD